MKRRIGNIDIDKISLNMIMLVNCFLCFFEEVVEMHFLVMFFYAVAIGLLIWKRKMTFVRGTGLMLLYILGIFLSIAVSGTSFRGLYRAGLTAMMVAFAAFADFDTDTLDLTKTALIFFGVFNAVAVFVQFLMKDTFTLLLYEWFNMDAVAEAWHYYRRGGYYAGVNTKPHETAGMIAAAIAVLFTTSWGKKNRRWLALPVCMFFPLLLTGKRAIFVLTAGCAVLVYVLTQLANRRWRQVAWIIAGTIAVGGLGVLVIFLNLDNPLFSRFATLFEGESFIDQTRLNLWGDAWKLFTKYPLFGVGFTNFNEWTVSYFGYPRSHSVNLDYLQFLCETGIIGFTLMMTPIIFTLVRTVKLGCYAAKENLPAKERDLVFFAVYMQFFVLLYALIEVPFYNNLFFSYYIFSSIIIHTYYAAYLAGDKKEKYPFDWVELFKNRPRSWAAWKACFAKAAAAVKHRVSGTYTTVKNRLLAKKRS